YGRASDRVVEEGEPVPRGGGQYLVGRPYTIAGKTYVPTERPSQSQTGMASYYGGAFHGRRTANGEVYDMNSVSAAHPTMPLPSYVRVTNTRNGRSIIVRVNDRGPFHSTRLVDVSEPVAQALAFRNKGTVRVKVDYLGLAPLEGSDDHKLLASLRTDGKPALRSGCYRTGIAAACRAE
ncbi:MAG: septal ring lytic transglycosylase RlpA family protein, partial [Alphaproteobacteria bacterium]|nr:septal ring lytic transglycosylase RlpA family protein [Alphaproteobacteria bacterium]